MEKSSEQRELSQQEIIDEQLESEHYIRCMKALKCYGKAAHRTIDECVKNYDKLSKKHKDILSSCNYMKDFDKAHVCIDLNAAYLDQVFSSSENIFLNLSEKYPEGAEHVKCTQFDISKVRSTLKQVARDWSAEGTSERQACYQPIIDEILKHKPLNNPESEQIHVLVPGCGLARLAWEFARLGYYSTGNEFSLYMLFVAGQILNNTESDEDEGVFQHTIHPWVEERCNARSWQDCLRPVKFPDVDPSALPFAHGRFQMLAGDFMEVCCYENEYDCVASCFFLDTAHNIIEYVENVYRILKPGGILVNLGPLLYHFAEISGEVSIEISYEQLLEVVKKIGFEILKNEWRSSTYTCNNRSLMKYEYECGLLVARKPSSPPSTAQS